MATFPSILSPQETKLKILTVKWRQGYRHSFQVRITLRYSQFRRFVLFCFTGKFPNCRPDRSAVTSWMLRLCHCCRLSLSNSSMKLAFMSIFCKLRFAISVLLLSPLFWFVRVTARVPIVLPLWWFTMGVSAACYFCFRVWWSLMLTVRHLFRKSTTRRPNLLRHSSQLSCHRN